MNREYHNWWSKHLNRDMELLVFGHAGAKVLVFPTRDGRFFEYENLRLTESLRHKIEAGQLQLYCLDGISSESFYCFWAHPSGRIQRYLEYEAYVLEEVIPFAEEKNDHPCLISHGCSLGGYFAANIVFRHPKPFSKLVAFSGRYDLTLKVESFESLLGTHYDDEVYFNTPTHFLPGLKSRAILKELKRIDMIFVIGRQDPFVKNNEHLCRILAEKGISHRLHYWPGRAHRGRFWREMAPHFV